MGREGTRATMEPTMTNTDAAMVRYSFNKLVQARQALVIADRLAESAEDACACPGRRCGPACGTHYAWTTRDLAAMEVQACMNRHAECCEVWGPRAR